MRARGRNRISQRNLTFDLSFVSVPQEALQPSINATTPTRVRAHVGEAPSPFVLLLFYFRLSYCGPSILTEIVAKELILPMKNVIGF